MQTKCAIVAFALSLLSISAGAAPVGERLLALVPQDAQIVSGVRLTRETTAAARMSLVTHNNNVDFNDWLALVSVDPNVRVQEVVEVASSSRRGELTERLLLADGNFDAEHIDRAALQDGASEVIFAGVRVMIVLPFPREKDASVGVRWLAIADDRTALFGTPLLVQKALERRAARAQTDAALSARLAELQPGGDDWGLLTMPSDVFERHIGSAFYPAEAIQALTGSDDVAMAFQYRWSKATIDFIAWERDSSQTAVALNAQAQRLSARFTRDSDLHLIRIAVERRRVLGTFVISGARGNEHAAEMARR